MKHSIRTFSPSYVAEGKLIKFIDREKKLIGLKVKG